MLVAIYSRKSIFTGKGESIDNQIELCKNYYYKNYGNNVEFDIYEDEGFSGGNTNRPQFQKLLNYIKAKKYNALICYRLDRISRNVADFSATLELLQSNNCEFISIKEQFDTSTPMGRAMVYISSVFAQLERETIAERVRDNMLELAKTGRWLGGQEPYGFSSEKITYIDEELKERSLMKLSPIAEEKENLKLIFHKYLELQSISQVAKYLNSLGVKSKNNSDWSSSQLGRILINPMYVKSSKHTHDFLKSQGINVFGLPNGHGYLTYNKTKNITIERDKSEWIAAVAKHQGIISSKEWLEVQNILEKNKDKKITRLGTGKSSNALLTGLLKCSSCKGNMLVKQGHKSRKNPNIRYDYYVCGKKDNSYGKKCCNNNIRVDKLDKIVIDNLKAFNKNFFIESLSNLIDENNDCHIVPYKKNQLEKEIDIKKDYISSLIKQLSLSPNDEISEYLFNEIDKLNLEIKKMTIQLQNIENKSLQESNSINSIPIILDMFKNFHENFDLIEDVKQKRFILQSIIKEIIWNGKDFEIYIELMGAKKN